MRRGQLSGGPAAPPPPAGAEAPEEAERLQTDEAVPAGSESSEDGAREPRPGSNRASLARLGVGVAAIVALFVAFGATNLLIVILAIVAMVMIHELGHFVAAKRSHMKVTEYFLGFGPRIWSVRRGETEYGVKAIPAGGYVRIPGMTNLEEVDPEDEPRTYRQQPFHNRLAVALAGSFMHFVMAFLLAWGALVFLGAPQGSAVTVGAFVHWSGHAQSAAQQGGLRVGDRLVSVDGRKVTSTNQVEQVIRDSRGRPVSVVVLRNGHQVHLSIQPVEGSSRSDGTEVLGSGTGTHPIIGAAFTSPLVPQNPLGAVGGAFGEIGRVTTGTFSGLGQVFSPHGISSYVSQVSNSNVAARDARNDTPRLQSIVGAVQTATQGAAAGSFYLIEVLILLNIFIGLVNLLPMLPLDGGHVAIAVYERIRSRRNRPYHADAAKLMPVAYVVVLLLVVISVSALYLDLTHPVANPFRG